MKGGLLVLNWRSLLRVNQVTFSNSEIEATTVAISKPIWQIEAITVGNQIPDYQKSENGAPAGESRECGNRKLGTELGRRERECPPSWGGERMASRGDGNDH